MRPLVVTILFITWLHHAYAMDDHYRAASTAERGTSLSLETAIQLALDANPAIAVAAREQAAIEGVQVQAAVRPNPSISTFMHDTRSATRETTIQLNQPFELGNKRAARIEAADVRYDAAGASIEAQKAEIRAAVIAAFYEVLVAQERLSLARSSLELAQRARDAASKRVLAGKVSPVEETKSKVAESAVRIDLNQAQSLLNTARHRLSALPVSRKPPGRSMLYTPYSISTVSPPCWPRRLRSSVPGWKWNSAMHWQGLRKPSASRT
jgi:cobalt-zinc-cadmium efflux system outer membrane protein